MKLNALTLGLAIVGLAMTQGYQASAAKLQKPVIVRFNPQTGAAEQLVLEKEIETKEEAAKIAKSGKFKAMANENVAVNELDREAGASSWYWYCNYCYGGGYNYANYYPQYYYYGQSYYPYYNYSYNNCYYYYYSPRYYGSGGGYGYGWR